MDAFQAAMRQVAQEGNIPFTDLRTAYQKFEALANASTTRHQGYAWPHAGILTYDGVHPSHDGDEMLVAQHAGGILKALE